MIRSTDLSDTLAQLLQVPREQVCVEFKAGLNDPEAIGQYISAMSNAATLHGHDRAWIVWGVADDCHEVCGTSFDPFVKRVGNQALIMWLQSMTQPRADFTFHEVIHPQGRVVMLEVHAARSAPVAFQNVRYIRVDSHKVALSQYPDKEARLWAQLGLKEDWTGVVVPEASFSDLDPEAVSVARQRFSEFQIRIEADASRHDHIRAQVQGWSVETLLNKAHVTKQGRLTRAALLLLGKDEAAHFLSPADAKISWILRDADNRMVSSIPYGPPFLLATDRVFAQIRNVTLDHMPDGTLFPTAVQRYDNWVMREALHNAVAHQDYVLGGKVNVVEHPDRLVISNLGQFIPESVEWMLHHQSPPEHYRNQWLIDGMIRLRMIDQAGSGILRMFATQRQRLFPLPDYAFDTTSGGRPRVELTLHGQVLDTNFARALMSRHDLSLEQVLLLDRVQKGRVLNADEARNLREAGLIEGRAPRVYISAKIAETTGQKARYIQNRGLDAHYYERLVLEFLGKYGQATRADLDALLLAKLPDVLSPEQKANKLKNLMQAMRQKGLVHRHGSLTKAVWRKGEASA